MYYFQQFKQARITSLYIPFIDILIENLPRLSFNNIANKSLTDGFTSKPLSLGSNISSTVPNGSILTSSSGVTITHQNSFLHDIKAPSSSTSQFANESILDSDLSSCASKQRKTTAEAVLGVIAGIGMSLKLTIKKQLHNSPILFQHIH